MPKLIVTAIGNDRPGIVGQLTGSLHSSGVNILESRMVNLRGQFAILLLLEAPDPGAVKNALPQAGREFGLSITVAEPPSADRPAPKTKGLPFRLKTYSLDQPGVVHRVSEVLRSLGVNIEDLAARQESAPFAGDLLFIMEMRLTVPPSVSVKKLRTDLEAVCEKLNADLDLEPA
jgi:glycine cleavage system transcriptional repressor